MRSKFIGVMALLLFINPLLAQYREAVPGYRYEFPRDNFNHPEFQTEWWYYTGNLKDAGGHEFGFELTFFREALSREQQMKSDWSAPDVYMAHLALSDISGGKFYHRERLNRAGPGVAGVDAETGRIWNGNWQILWKGDTQNLQAVSDPFALRLTLESKKPPVIHGIDGVSQKSAGAGHASHYISLTRLATSGEIELGGEKFEVTGAAWMDHEFFTQQLSAEQVGWDWFSLQLDDNTELMLFRLRLKDGSIDPFSSGTYIDATGKSTHLTQKDFSLQPEGETWKSESNAAVYPVRWRISVPSLKLDIEATTPLKQQELAGKTAVSPSYWEGAIRLAGTRDGSPATGAGYLEMTGYDRPVQLGKPVTDALSKSSSR
ncbi:MAG TPA: lipocalin-like domain-containing protein [Candidatus Acidoferrales bacterium]